MKTIPSRLRGEQGQVWTYALQILLVAFVLGVIITQAGPVIWNHISINGTADDALSEAVTTYRNYHGDMDRVYDIVEELLAERDARLVGEINVIYDSSGKAVSLTISVRKIVNTYFFENVSYLSSYTEATATKERNLE